MTYSRLDYAGISLLIFGGCYPFIYYGFACDDVFWLKALFLAILFTFALVCSIVTFIPKFDRPEFRSVRAFMFIGYGLCPIVPMEILAQPDKANMIEVCDWIFMIAGLIYISGALIYVARTPERFSPGKFDMCGASH